MSTCAFSIDQLMELAGLSVSQVGQSCSISACVVFSPPAHGGFFASLLFSSHFLPPCIFPRKTAAPQPSTALTPLSEIWHLHVLTFRTCCSFQSAPSEFWEANPCRLWPGEQWLAAHPGVKSPRVRTPPAYKHYHRWRWAGRRSASSPLRLLPLNLLSQAKQE